MVPPVDPGAIVIDSPAPDGRLVLQQDGVNQRPFALRKHPRTIAASKGDPLAFLVLCRSMSGLGGCGMGMRGRNEASPDSIGLLWIDVGAG